MKRFSLILVCSISMWAMVFSEPLKMITPKVLEFGKVSQGEEIKGVFKILITGSKGVEIESIRPGCGCTVIKDLAMTYNSGDTLIIPFTLNTRGFSGTIRKNITISFKSPGISDEILYISATVFQDLSLSKRYVLFKNVKVNPSAVITDSLYLMNASEKDVRVTDISFSSDLITIDYEKKSIAPKDSLLIIVRLHPLMPMNAPVLAQIITDISNKRLPGLDLRIYMDIRE